MLLTRECDYGIRVIRALAGGSKKTVDTIAAEELVPKKYAYKIIKKLERAGFVKSVRGRSGGYLLLKNLDAFSLLDVIAAVDPDRYISDCIKVDSICPFKSDSEKACSVHKEIERIQVLVESELHAKPMNEILGVSEKPS